MDRQTRHELKHDELRETLDNLEQYLKAHLREILTVVILVVVVVGEAAKLKESLEKIAPVTVVPADGGTASSAPADK